MKTCFDSSAFVKRYVREAGTDDVVDAFSAATDAAVCVLTLPETHSALHRRRREGRLTDDDVRLLTDAVALHLEDMVVLNLTPTVIAKSLMLLAKYRLRTLDALHVATALVWEAELFVTADTRQATVAETEGLSTRLVGSKP